MVCRATIHIAVLFVIYAILPKCLWAQLKPGIVVEEVAKNSESENAGLKGDDVLLGWSRGGAKGEIESPFDLSDIETEQEPRGDVTLEGLHGAERRTWVMGPGHWGLETRPQLPEKLLLSYQQGQELAKAGKLDDGAAHWRQAAKEAKELPSSSSSWLSAWFYFRIAEALSGARQWKEVDAVYEDLVQHETDIGPQVKGQFLRSWAYTYEQRGDWANAAKYYQQALAESQKSGKENLISATDQANLGNAVFRQGKMDQAAEYLHQALAISEKLAPSSLISAASLMTLGKITGMRGDYARAEEYCLQSLEIRKRLVPGSLDVGASLNALGNIHLQQEDLAKAESYYQRALEIREKLAPDGIDLTGTLANLGSVAFRRGDLVKAEEYYLRVFTIREKLEPGTLDVSESLIYLGNIAGQRGDPAKAQQYYTQALAIAQRLAPDTPNTASVLYNLGWVLNDRGDLFKAEESFWQALKIVKKSMPGSQYEGSILTTLGDVAFGRGDLSKAEESYTGALAIQEKLTPDSLDLAWTLDNLGLVARERGDLPKAEEYFHRTLSIREKVAPGGLDVAVSLRNLGDATKDRGDPGKTEEYYRRAITIEEKLAPAGTNLAASLQRLGDLLQDRGDVTQAEDCYRRALAIREKQALGSKEDAESLVALARIMGRKHQLDEAGRFYEQALDALESQTARLGGSEEIRARFRARYEKYYKDYVELLLGQKKPELAARAFQVLERFHARSLLETLAAASVDIHQGVDATLIDEERSLQDSIRAKTNLRLHMLSDKNSEQQRAALEKEIARLLGQYHDIEEQIRAASPTYAALTQPQPLSATQVQQQLLDSNTVLLEYSLGEDRSYVFAMTPTALDAYELPKRAEIESSTRRLYQLLKTWNSGRQAAELRRAASALSEVVLAPVASQLKGKRLVIVSDGALQYIPFAVLPVPRPSGAANASRQQTYRPLIIENEIVKLPSASVLAVVRQQASGRQAPARAVAVLADPVFDKDDERVTTTSSRPRPSLSGPKKSESGPASQAGDSAPYPERMSSLTRSLEDLDSQANRGLLLARLPYTRQEARAILAVTPAGDGMKALDFEASRATATDPKLAQYRIVHFATHSFLDSEHPELSGVVLSLVDQKGNGQDGFLGLQDVYNMNLPADLVVLSACETGLGKEIQGEGLIGLTRGFMYAGATRVMASLWKVDDVATAELMRRFYEGVEREGMRPAAALQRAQIAMWKQSRWSDPYYWAAFEVQGEWK